MAAPAVGSSSFLGLDPGSRDPAAPRRRRPRGSRNRKKGWKRWAGPEARLGREIGDFLEDVALQQRATGGLVSEQPDEGLFFLDTGSTEKGRNLPKKKEKPLFVDLLLQPQSKVPPPKNILAFQVPNGRKEKKRKEFWAKKEAKGVLPPPERRLRRRRMREGGGNGPPPPKKPAPPPEKGRSDPQREFYDIWGGHTPPPGQDPWFLQQTKTLRVKRPPMLPPKFGGVPAVEVIAPGGSYNPTFEDHQALLLQAHLLEVRKRREEEKVEKRLKVPPGTLPPSEESVLREQSEGLLEESGGEEEEEEEEPKSEENAPKRGPPPEKKTEKQRRKEKEARALRVRARGERAARVRAQALFRLRGLRKELERRERELRERGGGTRAAKKRLKDTRPPRLGPRKYEEPPPEVQLSEELAGSLRGLKPEGSVLRERFRSLQKRNLIEPRERARFKRRHRLKYVEKRAFREVTL